MKHPNHICDIALVAASLLTVALVYLAQNTLPC